MEIIYSDSDLKEDLIQNSLNELFPKLIFFNWDMNSPPPVKFDSQNPLHVIYYSHYDSEKIEFPFCLTIQRTPEIDSQEREIYIVRHLHKKTNTRYLVGYTDPDQPDYPYFSLIFENDQIFLSDDFKTNFADGETGLVQKIRPISLPFIEFSEMGRRKYECH